MFDRSLRVVRVWSHLGFKRIVLTLAATGALSTQAADLPCPSSQPVSLNVSATSINLGQSTLVNWDLHWERSVCELASLRLYYRDATTGVLQLVTESPAPLASSGSAIHRPQSSGTYFLRVSTPGWITSSDVGSATVSVALPVLNGRTAVAITQPNQSALFAQAIAIENAVVRIAGNVNLDLSGMSFLRVAPGVQILGDRISTRTGPRLFTNTFPRVLLQVGADGAPSDGVRISGIRLDGGESYDPFSAVGKEDADGIAITASQNVEIDRNEIFRWRGSAVSVHDGNNANDPNFIGRINRDNANTVRIHDNYIHHNQHPSADDCAHAVIDGGGHSAGYGVEVADGAFALIERNVFDWNRHSIAGDGKAGTGYFAFRNLILKNGGVHFRCLSEADWGMALALFVSGDPLGAAGFVISQALTTDSIYHTHALDMHAVNDCSPGDHNCGPAGEFMDIEFNTILYTAGNGIHLRGTPTSKDGMVVKNNVFAHADRLGGIFGGALSPGAMVQNESGLHDSNNIFGLDTFSDRKSCDFDGDGEADPMIATGAGLWYSSSMLDGRWVFLAQSPARLDEVTFDDIDDDGRCDVLARGEAFLNPDPQPFAQNPGNVSSVVGAPAALNLIATGGARPYSWTIAGLPPGLSASTAGQISGSVAVGAGSNYRVTATAADVNHQLSSVVFNWTVTALVPNLRSLQLSDATSQIRNAGLILGRVSSTNSCIDAGSVMMQLPAGGSTAPIGSRVDLTMATCNSTGDGGGGGTHPK
jgi:hypothetical protein